MQEVLPNVFLGPLQVARVNSTLHANKITMLVPVRTPTTVPFLGIPKDDNGLPWSAFPVDVLNSQIMGWFYKTYLRVKEELEKGGRVFVYCENGNDLSAAICVALVMDTKLYYSFCRWMLTVDGTIEPRGILYRESGFASTFRTGHDSHLK
jgi:hypothetical protein